MTTPTAAVAEYWRLKPLIYNDPPGWDTPVTVQEWPPNTPRYSWASMGDVDHCGLSVNALLHNIGLVFEQDFPNCAWTPTAREWADTQSPVAFTDIQPGDLLLYRNAGNPETATHIGIALSYWSGDGVLSGEFNTTIDGMGREYWRTDDGYLVAAGRPMWRPGETIKDYFHTTAEGAFLQWWVDNTDLPLVAVAGIAGNVQQESGFRPGAVEKAEQGYTLDTLDREAGPNANAAGYGLYQHSFDRLWAADGLLAWAAIDGYDPHTMEGQNAYALWELQTRARFAGILDELRAAPDAHTAALIFGKFEGFNPAYEGLRNEYAVAIWDRIAAGEFGPLTRTTPATSTAPRPRLIQGDDMATLWFAHADDDPNVGTHYLVEGGVPSEVRKPGVGLTAVPIPKSEFDAWLQSWSTANNLEPSGAYAGAAAGRPVYRPIKV